MAQSPIPQLTPFQTKYLTIAANSVEQSFAITLPEDFDTPENKVKLSQMVKDSDQLIELGLVTEITDKLTAQVEATQRQFGRRLRVFFATNAAFKLFQGEGCTCCRRVVQ